MRNKKMTTENNRHYKALELDKILEMLSGFCSCEDSKYEAVRIEPQTEIRDAQRLLGETESAYILLAKFGGPSFGSLKNVNNSLARAAAGGVLSIRELMTICEDLRVIRSLYEWRHRQSGVDTGIDTKFSALRPNKYFEDKINTAVLNEDELSDNASPALAEIRRKIRRQSSSVREKLDSITRSSAYQKYLQDAIVTQRNGRFVVPVKNEYRNEIPGLVHDTSASGATVFIEPMSVVEANNEIRVLQGKEQDEIERILAELSAQAGEFENEIKYSYEIACELNLIFAKAQLAYKMKASVPILNNNGIIDIKSARHPLLDKNKVVPVDIRLGGDFDSLVITGPNTGGKTVSIKTLGLITLMAMCGLMIPASDNSKICVFKNVFADIGDEQSIEQSLSTFSSHMVNIVDISKHADSSSLILIDELGAGTDPVEGAALAISILEDLRAKGAKIAATTHYAELKAYALQTDRVENGSCEFDVATLRPTYRLLIGVPGRSNAFAISEKLGISPSVIEKAKEMVSGENIRFEDVIDSLESRRAEMEKAKSEAEELRRQNEELKKKAETRLEDIEEMRRKEFDKARSDAMRLVENARREANSLMFEVDKIKKELKNGGRNAEFVQKAKSQIKKSMAGVDSAVNPVTESADDGYVLSRPIKVGDTVKLAGMNSEATVLSLADKNGEMEVQSGIMKLRVKADRLRLVEKPKQKTRSDVKRVGESRVNADVSTRCDLRGMTSEEAIMTLDSFIDSMVMAGLKEFTIIHGKGTGVLRSAVQQHLKRHPQIKSYRLGTFGEGENGVTIAETK